ncbi:citrate/2-methylcitrate synthase [Pseudomonas sp. Marseille-Q8238]
MDGFEDDLYLSAEQAAQQLGISLPTLYAYVSRKNIRSVKVDGSRSRRYWAADIERLAKGKSAAEGSGGLAELQRVAATSAITLLTEQGLYYRGQDVLDLVQSASVEDVAELMWQVPGVFDDNLPRRPKSASALLKLFNGASSAEKAIALFPLVENENPKAHDLSKEGYARTSVDVVRWFAALVVGADGPDVRPLHQFIAQSCGVDGAFEDLIRRVLILSVDHELDPSAFTVRAAANTGVSPYYAAITGLASFRGRRISYGRSEIVTRFLEEVCSARDPAMPVLQRFRQGEALPGFGSNVHGVIDPRAMSLMATLSEVFRGDEEFKRLLKAAEVAEEVVQQPVDFILLLTFVGRKLGLVGQEIALAGIGRAIGWLAHASEQYHHQGLVRPRAKYVGILPD